MAGKEEVIHWLTQGMQKSAARLFEGFYYDKRDCEFFEIINIDYFMLDENLNVAEDVSTTYSKKDQLIISDRIKRIDVKDQSIIEVPRFGETENGNNIEFISEQIENFLNSNSIGYKNSTIWEPEGGLEVSVSTKVDSEKRKKTWWKFW